MRVGILNVAGYAGIELTRILARHPEVEVTSVTGRSAAGQRLAEAFPHAAGIDLPVTEELSDVDFVFSALGHTTSASKLLPLIASGVPVVDLSGDFRLKSAGEYRQWYDADHPEPERLNDAVYGLTELHRDELRDAKLVANPGCYATGAVLALAPAVKAGLVTGDIVIDGKSGVSGAGRTLRLTSHFSEVNENLSAYGLDGHYQYPEMVQELHRLNPAMRISATFLPHLIPITRGILSSCYALLRNGAAGSAGPGKGEALEVYRDFYREDPFVTVTSTPPQTKQTLGSNTCLVYPTVDERTGRLIVVSAIDNLVKGAAGGAVQNMNVMMGWPETLGLEQLALYP